MDLTYLSLNARDLRIEQQQLLDAEQVSDTVAAELTACATAMERDGTTAHQQRARELLDRCASLSNTRTEAEPADLATIHAARPDGPRRLDTGRVDRAQITGAWIGRCVGCRLGKPVETWTRRTIHAFLEATDQTLDGYLHADVAGGTDFDLDATGGWNDRTTGVPRDDDIDFTVAALLTVAREGYEFTSDDLARTWLEQLPACKLHTAERVAYRNLLEDVSPPASAYRRNPYREFIGAQIRGDCYGYLCPGNPERAAALAYRDARVTHVRNGIYGGMWVAATLAAVPGTETLREAIAVGITEVPGRSRLATALEDVLTWADDGVTYDAMIDRIHDEWDDGDFYEGYHVTPNAQVVAATLLEADEWSFTDAVGRAVAAGFDTDCNAATVGSMLGLARGANAIPARLAHPVRTEIRTALADRPRWTIEELVDETIAVSDGIE